MKSLIRKTKINLAHFIFGLPFLFTGILLYYYSIKTMAIPFLAIGMSLSFVELLYGETPLTEVIPE